MTDDNSDSPMVDGSVGEEPVDVVVGSTGKQKSSPPLPLPPTKAAIEDDATEDVDTDVGDDDENDDGEDTEIMEPDGDNEEENLEVAAKLDTNQEEIPLPRSITKAFVYGSVSQALPRPLSNGHTHAWTIYLRPRYNEDMSRYVSRVEFRLHESFEQPIRVCTQPPYEVSETGWGEFDILIKIFFVEKSLRPLALDHILKLFKYVQPPVVDSPASYPLTAVSGNWHLQPAVTGDPILESDSAEKDATFSTSNIPSEPNTLSHSPPLPLEPLVVEHYDELIFANPSDGLHSNLLRAWEDTRSDWVPPNMDWDEEHLRQLEAIQQARTSVKDEIDKLKNRLKNMKNEWEMIEREVARMNAEMDEDQVEIEQMIEDAAAGPGGASRDITVVDTKPEIIEEMGSGGDE